MEETECCRGSMNLGTESGIDKLLDPRYLYMSLRLSADMDISDVGWNISRQREITRSSPPGGMYCAHLHIQGELNSLLSV